MGPQLYPVTIARARRTPSWWLGWLFVLVLGYAIAITTPVTVIAAVIAGLVLIGYYWKDCPYG